MEYNLVHAMIGRFAVLIPLLGLFFEVATLITQKELVFKLAGGIVILGSILAIIAGLTGAQEYFYLMEEAEASVYFWHAVAASVITFSFVLILIMRITLFFKKKEALFVVYMIIYVLNVIANLFSNEVVVHTLREHLT
ncbi:hypothetical protein [Persephonella sp.]|uniref:hypothetical protein n=1 Tax=Persephonella sp. TaxID=2060922 RepID=UPI00262C7B2C|nr:hypothetical protein [Persephonella sp.]